MKRLLIAVAAIILLSAGTKASAIDISSPGAFVDDLYREQSEALGTEELQAALPDDAREMLGDLSVADAFDPPGALERLFGNITAKLREVLFSALKNTAVLVMAAMFSGLFSAAFPDGNGNYARLAGVLAISAVSVASVNTFIGMGANVLTELVAFSHMLLPTLAAAAAAGGAITSAAAKYAASVLFIDVMMSIMKNVILPLIFAYIATSVAEAAVGGETLSGASKLLKWLAKTTLTALVLIFITYISLTGVITSATDAVAVRAARVAMSTVLPVVGGMLSDAADAVLSGASMLRNAVGVFGMLVVAATCAVPFLRLGINYLLFKAAGGLSGAVADSSVTKLIDAFGAAFGLTLAMVGASAVMLFVSIVVTIKTVT